MTHGNGANGATHHDMSHATPLAESVADDSELNVHVSAEYLQKIRESLSGPFDPGEIKWRVTATSTYQTVHGPQRRGRLVAYADQRAYTDRLNEIFGEWGWTRNYDVQVSQNFERRIREDNKRIAIAAKVVVVSNVRIHGLGSHTGVGEEWADDENAATRAEAQAFKRACACFGLGRYLYDLDTVWVDLDQNNRPVRIPNLPEWASTVRANSGVQRQEASPAARLPNRPREQMLAEINGLRQDVGEGLSHFVLNKYANGRELDTLDDTTLTIILQKLTDIAKGIHRLRKGIGAVGDARYSAICRELKLTRSINEIPDRDSLQCLLSRVEAAASQENGGAGARHSSKAGIADARGRLLQAARELADKTHRRLGDVIAEASDGNLSLDRLRDLTDADVLLVSQATGRMGHGEISSGS